MNSITSPRYSQHVSRTSNMYPATCVRQHICIRIQVARPGYMFPGDMCPGVNAALRSNATQDISRDSSDNNVNREYHCDTMSTIQSRVAGLRLVAASGAYPLVKCLFHPLSSSGVLCAITADRHNFRLLSFC